GDFEQAGAHLARCLARSPHDPDALLLSARLARRQGNLDQADRHLRTYDANYGRDEPYAVERMLLRGLKDGPGPDHARSFREHLDRDNSRRASQAIDVFETLTLGYRQLMQATATLHCANELLEVDPDHVRGLVARGWALEQFNRMNEALAAYEKAARLDPA